MPFDELPEEILHKILCQIDGWSVIRCRAVCKRWRDAVDNLGDQGWKRICENDAFEDEYVAIKNKSRNLSWRDVFRAAASWCKINLADMKVSPALADGVQRFKVLPGGIIACLQKSKNLAGNFSDTILYYNTETGQQIDKQQFDFVFFAELYDENEYLQVFVVKDKRLCVIVKQTKKKYFVGSVEIYDLINCCAELTLIGKEVYFKNKSDQIIYCSKLTDKKVLKTKCLEAFEENHENFDAETIIAFGIKKGILHFMSDEGSTWRFNIYDHQNADFGCNCGSEFDDPYLLTELAESGLDWKNCQIFAYLIKNRTRLFVKNCFFSQGMAMLVAQDKKKTIEMHHVYVIYAVEHLALLLKKKPKRTIVLKEVLPNESGSVVQMDILETPISHKVLVLIGKKLYIFEFSHVPGNTDTKQSPSTSKTAKAKTSPAKTSKTKKTVKKPASKVVKKKAVLAKKKAVLAKKKVVEKALATTRSAYSTRSSNKL